MDGAWIEQSFLVEGECHGWRLDRFLQKKIRRLSRARIKRVIRGECDVAGRPAKPALIVRAGQVVRFRRPVPSEPEVPREVKVRHEDPCFYVLEKPAGLPIHPSARYHLSTLTQVLRERFPGERLQVCHRLDRETSGLILIARDPLSAARLKGAFAMRKVEKRYLAIVSGVPERDHMIIDYPIGPDSGRVRVKMAVRAVEEGGLWARTEVLVLKRCAEHALVECRPLSGRQHQIRVHLAAIGHPVLGDKLYPDEEVFMAWADHGFEAVRHRLPLLRHALHAAGLSFPHPRSGEEVALESPLPADLQDFLSDAGPAPCGP